MSARKPGAAERFSKPFIEPVLDLTSPSQQAAKKLLTEATAFESGHLNNAAFRKALAAAEQRA